MTSATGGSNTLSQTSFTIPASGNGTGGAGQLPYQSVTVVQTLPQSVSGTIASRRERHLLWTATRPPTSGGITAPTNCPPSPPTTTTTTVPAPAPVAPAPASPTTIPVVVPSVAPTPTTIPTPPPAKKIKVAARSSKGPTVSGKSALSGREAPRSHHQSCNVHRLSSNGDGIISLQQFRRNSLGELVAYARAVARGVGIICSTTALAVALMLALVAVTTTPSSAVVAPVAPGTFRTT